MKKTCSLLAVLSLSLVTSAAFADTQGINFTSLNSSNVFNNGAGYSLGYAFTVKSNIDATALGFFYTTPYTQSHQVGLYNSAGTLLATANVTNASTTVGFFKYASISSVLLSAGQTYEVVGETGTTDPYTFNPNGFSVDPNITFDEDRYIAGSTLQFAPNSEGIEGTFGANFEEAPVTSATPEPGTFVLLGTGLVGAAGAMRRKLFA